MQGKTAAVFGISENASERSLHIANVSMWSAGKGRFLRSLGVIELVQAAKPPTPLRMEKAKAKILFSENTLTRLPFDNGSAVKGTVLPFTGISMQLNEQPA